jgi:phosphoribosylformylglycinamidine synthase PurS subunit
MKARVTVTLKNGILDPQGKAIEGALRSQHLPGIEQVRQGKIFDIEVLAASKSAADALLREACLKLLVNQVVEDFSIEIFDHA